MINEKDLKEINPENLKIFFIKENDINKISEIEKFIYDLKNHIPIKVEFKREELLAYPALKLTDKEEKIQIYYLAIPEKLEWIPFLNTLKALSKNESFLSEEEVKRIENLINPIEIKIFITPFCPFCPSVVDKANQIAIAQSLIKTFIIDATMYPTLSQKYKVTASPTVIINEDFFLVGNEAKENLLSFLEKANETAYDKEVLKNLLKQAQAERVIELCKKNEKCLYSLIELLKAPELFTRIGVMRVLEELAEKGDIGEKILLYLLEMLKNAKEERDKGDILYLLGLIGDPEIIPQIEKIVEKESDVIKEIAQEAIEEIRKRKISH